MVMFGLMVETQLMLWMILFIFGLFHYTGYFIEIQKTEISFKALF